MTKARDISKLLSTANGKIAGANLDVSFENISDSGTAGTKVASGTTGQRGSTAGQIRFNTTTGLAEYYTGTDFKVLDAPPTITAVSPLEVDSQAGGNITFTITGTNFGSGATIKFIGNDATEITASTTTVTNSTTISAVIAKSSFINTKEPYDVRIINGSGLEATLDNQINVDSSPIWSTASGNIADITEVATGTHATVTATDIDSDTISYSLLSGSLGGLSLNSSTGVISGDPTDVASDTTLNFTLRATANSKTADRAFNIIIRNYFSGGNQSANSIEALAKDMLTTANTNVTTGGTLTVNSLSLGSYDYYKTSGATTISSFNSADYFNSTADTRSSFLVFNGNLTINSGQVIIPPVRKLFTVVYVNGNLVINGSIKMTSRGANHSGGGNSGGYIAPQNIKLITGTYSSVTDATIPQTGGSGGAAQSGHGQTGANGNSITRGSGGGGSGASSPATSGAGASGTCFTGGSGGGGADNGTAQSGVENGGSGGHAGGANAGGGAGNPAGNSNGSSATQNTGTGGTLIVYCTGTISGSGSIEAKATDGGQPSGGYRGGGGAGGGIIQVFCNSGTISTNVSGGINTTSATGGGGVGGSGSADIYTGYSG